MSKLLSGSFCIIKLLTVLLLALSVPAFPEDVAERAANPKPAGAVYALTNSTQGNAVVIFLRAKDGTLTPGLTVPTGGQGIGDGPDTEGIQSQGALILDKTNKFLYACNPGSDDITVFSVSSDTLGVVQKISSGGHRPISVTIFKKVFYVLNYDRFAGSGSPGNITGFNVDSKGMLTPIPGSTRSLGIDGLNPGQVLFSPNGKLIAMTAKATNQIFTFQVDLKSGLSSAPVPFPSAGIFPFSLAFAGRTGLVVADDFEDVPGKGASSSYSVSKDGSLTLVSGAVPDHQDGACWIITDKSGNLSYVSNTNNSVIAGYHISNKNELSLVNADGVTGKTGGIKPRDLAYSKDFKFLYVLNSASGTVAGFKANKDGSLTSLGAPVGSIPKPGSNGLAAR
jgi:6-phosphogluconolactonase (cycloisomerase 2 family)